MALRKAYDIRRRIFTAGSGRDMAVGRDTMSRPFCGEKHSEALVLLFTVSHF